jgi:hypothetical protein
LEKGQNLGRLGGFLAEFLVSTTGSPPNTTPKINSEYTQFFAIFGQKTADFRDIWRFLRVSRVSLIQWLPHWLVFF